MDYLNDQIMSFFKEDDLGRNINYQNKLPKKMVRCQLEIKSDCFLSGLPFFFQVFKCLGHDFLEQDTKLVEQNEGSLLSKGSIILEKLELPFDKALTGERLALNLLQRSTSISTMAKELVELAKPYGIKILDTRKTTPGLRFLEKYAVAASGAYNHRFGQMDMFMIKDNHKNYFGGLVAALTFFKEVNSAYVPILLEIHNLDELRHAQESTDIRFFMLDNFSPEEIKEAIALKKAGNHFEVSGGINAQNIDRYLIEGVDAISVGALTHSAPTVDLSFKYKPIN